MPILQHFKWFFKYLFKGADRDNDPEITGASEDAVYFDSFNGRTTSVEGGEKGAWKKINGEELKYENKDNNCLTGTGLSLSDSYKCLYSGNFFLDTDYIIEKITGIKTFVRIRKGKTCTGKTVIVFVLVFKFFTVDFFPCSLFSTFY